jgi:hypothetical protein
MTELRAPGVAQLPPEVARLAASHAMGEFRQAFPPSKRLRLIVPLIVLALIFGGLGIAGAASAGSPAGAIAFALGFAGIPLALLLWALFTSPLVSGAARRRVVYVFEHGFVQVTRKGPVANRWDAMRFVYQEIVNIRAYGISTGTNYKFTITMTDGRKVKLTHLTTDMAALGPVIQTGVAAAQVPRAIEVLRQGQIIYFGEIGLSVEGITVNQKEPVPWAESGVNVAQGYVRVFRAGKRMPVGNVAAKKIPNLATFLTLVDRLSSTQGELRRSEGPGAAW